MSVLSLVQDPRAGGGVSTVERWYRAWMERHRPQEFVERYLDDSRSSGLLAALERSQLGSPEVPNILPKLHVPPYLAGRRFLSKDVEAADEVHVVGGVALHGSLAPAHPRRLIWIATTVVAERRAVTPLRDWRRRALHRITLPILNRLEGEVLNGAKRILAMSPYTADVILAEGVPSAAIEVVPVPIDTTNFHPGSDDREGVLFVGRAHDPRKNFGLLVNAFASSETLNGHVLHIVSPGPALDVPSSVPRVKWWGTVENLSERYRSAAVFALPSVQEGLGIVVFEALACGTPVVVTRCGGPESWVEASGGGFVVDGPTEMAGALLKLLSNGSMAREMGAAGREWVQENASGQKFLDNPSIFVVE